MMMNKQIQAELVRLVNDVEYAALGFHATGGIARCIRAKGELHAYIAQLEQRLTMRIAELEAQLESVGAGGVGAMMPKHTHPQAKEREAYIAYLTTTFPNTYSEDDAQRWWAQEHISALAWEARSALAPPHPQQVAGLEKDAEITALKAERDALLAAAKYAEHIDAAPETQLQTMLHDTLTERDALRKDAERLDWLDQNIFSRENINFMGQLDPTMNMWVTFSPKGHQGSARNILDAAMQAQEVKPS